MSDVPADWNRVQGAVSIRNEMKSNALIIGNGDVRDLFEAQKRIEETGADGVMLGRAIFGNPWLFLKSQKAVSVSTKLNTMVEHAKLFEKLFKGLKNFAIMKKHFKAYASGFDGAKELRIKLMETSGADEVAKITKQFLKGLK